MPKYDRFEQANVDLSFSRVVAPTYWCEELQNIDVASIARLQRMMCNHGMEVVGDTTPPLHQVMGVHRTEDEATLMFNHDLPSEKRWKRRVILDKEDQDWENQFLTPSSQIITPEAGVDSGLSVSFSHTPPEVSVFAELPMAKSIKAAARLASRQLDVRLDPAPYLDQFERWFGMPNRFISDVLHKTTIPISVPRLLAAGGKSASPVYGIENFSGIVRFIEPSATKDSFVTKDDSRLKNEIAVDFSYYRSAVRWIMSTALQVPGPIQDVLAHKKGTIGFDISMRGRVVVPEKAMEFNIPTLIFEAPDAPSFIIKETKRAIENAMNGRTAVLAGVILGDSESLISAAARDRMGKIRDGKGYKKTSTYEVKEIKPTVQVHHAQAGVGLRDYCINMLGANEEHLTRNPTLLGRLSGIIEQKGLNVSRDHCVWVSMLWDATFKNSFQRMCQANSSSLDDFVSQSPEDYPYDARISYSIMKNRIGSVVTRIKSIESMFTVALKYERHTDPIVSDFRTVITAWAAFYSGKAQSAEKGWRRIRAQLLSSFYAQTKIQGNAIAFPDLKEFLIQVVYNYGRRQKLETLDFTGVEEADTVASAADDEYQPDYKFTDLLRSLTNMSKWTLADMVAKKDNMEAEDAVAEEDATYEVISGEEMDALAAMEANFLANELNEAEEYSITAMKGPLKMRSKFFAICEVSGSEKDFIHTKLERDFDSFADWNKLEPEFYDSRTEMLAKAYMATFTGDDAGEEDDADLV